MIRSFGAVWLNPYVRVLVVIALAVAVYFVLRATQFVWSTALIAFLVAYLLSPIVTRLERRGVPRGLGVFTASLVFAVLVAGLWALGTAIAAQITVFADELPRLIETLEEIPFVFARLVDPTFGAMFEQVYVTTRVFAQGIANEVLPSVADVGAGGLTGVITAVTSIGMQVTIVMVLSIYLLYRYPIYGVSLLRAVPERHRALVSEIAAKADTSVGGYIRGQILISAVVGVLTGIGLTLLGVPLAAPLAVLVAILNVIPFFGPIVVSIPTVMMALTLGIGPAIASLAVLVAVNQIDAHILTPLIYSRTIELDPVTIVISILLGLALFGLVGALLAVPLAAFLKLLYADYYLSSRWYAESRRGSLGWTRDESSSGTSS
jgi:predicted PurR-regulated permease PerM